jgi:KUP system potassium uptake protein
MLVTVTLAAIVIKKTWKLNPYLAGSLLLLLFSIDLIFLISNISKFMQGGWFPVLIAGLCFVILMTWYAGQKILRARTLSEGISVESFIKDKMTDTSPRVDGLAVFLADNPRLVPPTLISNFKQNGVFHKHIVLLKISIWDVPLVDDSDRLTITELGRGVFSVRAVYGFTEKVDVNAILKTFNDQYHFVEDLLRISIFAPRASISTSPGGSLPLWRQKLFAWLVQNETQAVDYYDINLSCVVQMGLKVQL